jgi:hypothetical protein
VPIRLLRAPPLNWISGSCGQRRRADVLWGEDAWRQCRADRAPARRLPVEEASFGGALYCTNKRPRCPTAICWANPCFGTMVSDSALGFTWAGQCAGEQATPWYNDIHHRQTGGTADPAVDGSYYDLTRGTLASFSKRGRPI